MRWQKEIKRVCSRAIIAYGIVAVILFFLGDYKKACVVRLNTIATWGDYPMDLAKNKGVYDKRRLYMAIRYYKILQDLYPQSDQPSAMIGYCYSFLNENDLTIKYFKKAKMKSPDHFWHDYNLGEVYYRSGRYEDALVRFKEVVNNDPNSLVKAVIIAPLNTMATDQRQQFYAMAANFAVNIRSLSLQMIIKIYLRNQRYQEAIEASLMALNDQTINDKRMFALYVAVARGLQEDDKFLKDSSDFKQLFQNGTEEFVFHPWAYFIQPGKELYL